MSGTTNSPDVTADNDEAEKAGLSLSIPQVAGGALASMITAFAASFLGVAGTLIGAAFGSVLSSIGTVVFGHSLIKARRTLKKVPAIAPNLATDRSSARSSARRPAWQPVALLAGCVFLAAMAAIWVTEVAIGHPISGGTGKGTTIGDVVHGRVASSHGPSPSGSASTEGEPSPSGSDAPNEGATSPAAGSSQAEPGPSGTGAATG